MEQYAKDQTSKDACYHKCSCWYLLWSPRTQGQRSDLKRKGCSCPLVVLISSAQLTAAPHSLEKSSRSSDSKRGFSTRKHSGVYLLYGEVSPQRVACYPKSCVMSTLDSCYTINRGHQQIRQIAAAGPAKHLQPHGVQHHQQQQHLTDPAQHSSCGFGHCSSRVWFLA